MLDRPANCGDAVLDGGGKRRFGCQPVVDRDNRHPGLGRVVAADVVVPVQASGDETTTVQVDDKSVWWVRRLVQTQRKGVPRRGRHGEVDDLDTVVGCHGGRQPAIDGVDGGPSSPPVTDGRWCRWSGGGDRADCLEKFVVDAEHC
ncbi:hypothetical protein OG400_21580 [Micromonospora ureilytica]|nr:hypothetical protein OG400_21580 [Micromonospora ureilytica]